MKCPESDIQLQRYMDDGVRPDLPEWERHLSECSACRENVSAAKALLSGLRQSKAPAPPDGFGRRVAQQVLAERPATAGRRNWRRMVWAAATMAACVALVLLARPLWLPSQTVSLHVAEKEPLPSVEGSVQEATAAVAALSGRLADNTKKQAQLLWSLAPKWNVASVDKIVPAGGNAKDSIEPAAKSLRDGATGVTQGVTVVAQTTRRAFSYFLRDLPSLTSAKVENN